MKMNMNLKRSSAALHDLTKSGLYAAVTLFVVFVCLSNTLNQIFKTIWSDVGNNWAYAWRYMEERSTPMWLFFCGTFMLHMTSYWTYSLLLAAFDLQLAPSSASTVVMRYKIQPTKNSPLKHETFMAAARVVLWNQICVGIPMMIITWPAIVWRGMSMTLPLPTFEQFLYEMAGSLIIEEFCFYWSHRMLHHKSLYGRIHKKHHEFTAPIGVAALYCHPLEHLFSNLIPVTLGPFIMGSHVAVMWAWQTLAAINSINSHSGYHFPLLPSPEMHDFHHLRYNQNFGVLGLLDYIHGTDSKFRSTSQYTRHRTYFSVDDYPASMALEAANVAATAITDTDLTKKDGVYDDDEKVQQLLAESATAATTATTTAAAMAVAAAIATATDEYDGDTFTPASLTTTHKIPARTAAASLINGRKDEIKQA